MKHWKPEKMNEHQRKLLQKADSNIAVSSSDLEQNISNEPVGTRETPKMVTPCRVHIHSRRYRLADPDGISGKAVIDGLVHARVLPDDTAAEISKVTFTQEKIK